MRPRYCLPTWALYGPEGCRERYIIAVCLGRMSEINRLFLEWHCYISRRMLHFAWVVDDAKCIASVCVCVCVCVCVGVCLSATVRPHYCTDPDVTWGSGRGCSLVVHYWADLQSGYEWRCCSNIMRTRNVSEYMLVLALCLVVISFSEIPLFCH